ncbi:MAG: hypothetical protein ABI557_20285 [Aureliella sp.]
MNKLSDMQIARPCGVSSTLNSVLEQQGVTETTSPPGPMVELPLPHPPRVPFGSLASAVLLQTSAIIRAHAAA